MILGLTGRAGAGKDTVAAILRNHHRFATMSFAGPLKKMLCALLSEPMEKWEDRDWKETIIPEIGKSPRQLAQTLGTEWGRECLGEDVWVNLGLHHARRIEKELNEIDDRYTILFTDVRFENEADAIRGLGGYIIHVNRPGHDGGTLSAHSSEDGIQVDPLRDVVLQNDGTLEDLEKTVFAFAFDARMMKQAKLYGEVQTHAAGSSR